MIVFREGHSAVSMYRMIYVPTRSVGESGCVSATV